MGLPEIIIEFKTKGVTAIKRSARGIVAIVLKDDTEEGQALNIYKSVLDVDPTHFTARNYEYLKLVYEGSPSKTIVLKVGTAVENLNPQLKQLNDLKWNYLVIPGITDDEKTTVSAWIKEARDDHHKTFKAVLPNCTADHEGIINLSQLIVHAGVCHSIFNEPGIASVIVDPFQWGDNSGNLLTSQLPHCPSIDQIIDFTQYIRTVRCHQYGVPRTCDQGNQLDQLFLRSRKQVGLRLLDDKEYRLLQCQIVKQEVENPNNLLLS